MIIQIDLITSAQEYPEAQSGYAIWPTGFSDLEPEPVGTGNRWAEFHHIDTV